MGGPIYLDYLASTPTDPEIARLVYETMLEVPGNPGSRTHAFGTEAKRRVEASRRALASVVGARPPEIIFTSGATESNNLAILGLEEAGRKSGRLHIVSTSIEHKAVLEPLAHLESRGFEITLIRPGQDGRVSASDVLNAVREDTVLVSVMAANNEIGTIQPVDEIISALRDSRTYVHVDCAQAFAKLDPAVAGYDADLLSISGHKICAPSGVGALVIRSRKGLRKAIRPISFGGAQESGLRPGTVATPLVVALSTASERLSNARHDWNARCAQLKRACLEAFGALDHTVVGDQSHCLVNCVSIILHGLDSEMVFLAAKEVSAISNGSACTSGGHSTSHVLRALALGQEASSSVVRISWSPDTNAGAFAKLVKSINQCWKS